MNGLQDRCIQECSRCLAVTRIQMVNSVHLSWWSALVLMLHTWRFTRQQIKSIRHCASNNTKRMTNINDCDYWLQDCFCSMWSRYFSFTPNLKLGCPVTTYIYRFINRLSSYILSKLILLTKLSIYSKAQ